MSKPKLKRKSAPAASSQAKNLMETAEQVWMAGMGALQRAQGEGTKVFENLVREGLSLEQKTRKVATGKVDEVRGAVEATVSQVKERAADTWDRLEKVFEERVSRALARLGVPGRDEMQALVDRVEDLNKAVRKLHAEGKAAPVRRAAAARSTPRSSISKAKQSVAMMAEAASELQEAATTAVRRAAKKATRAIKNPMK